MDEDFPSISPRTKAVVVLESVGPKTMNIKMKVIKTSKKKIISTITNMNVKRVKIV